MKPVVRGIWYVYPVFKHVSFSVVARKHVEQLRLRGLRVEQVDESAFPFIAISTFPVVIMHPFFYPFERYEEKIAYRRGRIGAIIGVDVADSDHITGYAVRLTGYADVMVVPSSFARESYVRSGVKVPVRVIPHGVDLEFVESPPSPPSSFDWIAKIKERENVRVLGAFIPHSGYRKGEDVLFGLFEGVSRERRDVVLVLRGAGDVRVVGSDGGVKASKWVKWMSEEEKKELLDLVDVFLLTSRGGGFELPCLEALARRVPSVAARGGAWEDYMPSWGLVSSHRSGVVLEGNPIHDGVGVEMDLDRGVDKVLEILDDYDEYRGRVEEHVEGVVKKRFTWGVVGGELARVVSECL